MEKSNTKLKDYITKTIEELSRKGINSEVAYGNLSFSPLLKRENRKFKKSLEEEVSLRFKRKFELSEDTYLKYGGVNPIFTEDIKGYDMEIHKVDVISPMMGLLFTTLSNGNIYLSRKIKGSKKNSFAFLSNIDNNENFNLTINKENEKHIIRKDEKSIIYVYNGLQLVINLEDNTKKVLFNNLNSKNPYMFECIFDGDNSLIKGDITMVISDNRKTNGRYKFSFNKGKITATGYYGDYEKGIDLFTNGYLLKKFYTYYLEEFDFDSTYPSNIVQGLLNTICEGFSDDFYDEYRKVKFECIGALEKQMMNEISNIKQFILLNDFNDVISGFLIKFDKSKKVKPFELTID